MMFENYLKEKTVIVCLSNGKIHLCDPFRHIWICDETKVADAETCEMRDKLLIRDFLTFSIQKTELLRDYGNLGEMWKRLDRGSDKRKSVAERFLSQINEYYLEESPRMKNASICEECLGIFLGNLYDLGREGLLISDARRNPAELRL